MHTKRMQLQVQTKVLVLQPFVGGPVINADGEVIGIAYCFSSFTPFLPSNVILRWLTATTNKRLIPLSNQAGIYWIEMARSPCQKVLVNVLPMLLNHILHHIISLR
jgi:hypothetical protein